MKRSIITIALVATGLMAHAQTTLGSLDKETTTELLRSTVLTIILFLVCSFILSVIRLILDNKLKNSMIEKGVPVEVIANMLPRKGDLSATVKWCCILTAISVGLLFINLTTPLGIHSIVIMGFSIAAGLLIYYFWAKKFNKQ
jgi:hypothetical protein